MTVNDEVAAILKPEFKLKRTFLTDLPFEIVEVLFTVRRVWQQNPAIKTKTAIHRDIMSRYSIKVSRETFFEFLMDENKVFREEDYVRPRKGSGPNTNTRN